MDDQPPPPGPGVPPQPPQTQQPYATYSPYATYATYDAGYPAPGYGYGYGPPPRQGMSRRNKTWLIVGAVLCGILLLGAIGSVLVYLVSTATVGGFSEAYESDPVDVTVGKQFVVDDDLTIGSGWRVDEGDGTLTPHGRYAVSDEWDYDEPRITFRFIKAGTEVDHALCTLAGTGSASSEGDLQCGPAHATDYDRIEVTLSDGLDSF